MSGQLQVDERAPVKDLQLLVQWSSPWQEFRTAIGPALARSTRPLAGEAQTGLFPYRNLLAVCALEFLFFVLLNVLPGKLAEMKAKVPAAPPKYDVLYFSADELPRTEDNGGSSAGNTGRAGGLHAFHRTQSIRVARGEVLREKVLDAPKLDLPHSDSAVANLLAYKASIPGPAPTEGLKSSRQIPSMQVTPIAPSPQNNLRRDTLLTAPKLDSTVVPPAPNALQSDALPLRLPGSQRIQVVPPPVSAPERASIANPKLTLPAPSIVAPPPTQITRDLAKTGPGYGPGELRPQIVPPTVQVNATTSDHRSLSGLGKNPVVPPPVDVTGSTASAHKLGDWNGAVPIAPPVNLTNGSLNHQRVAGLSAAVVPPAPNVSGKELASGNGSHTQSLGSAIVPPPPSVSSGDVGSGRGTRAQGLGAAMDVGSVSAPPASGGSGNATGVVISSQPGSTPAVPTKAGTGALAMSPTGGAKPGIGGAGGGTGIDYGTGTGSGASGESSGAAKSGTGRGSDTTAKAGISPYPGSGGAGSGTVGNPPLPGVSVHGGGNNIVTLPSFGTNGSAPSAPGRTPDKNNHGGGITVVATSRSGGAFNLYGTLKGDNYTIYLPTSLGTAVMQFADPASAEHPYSDTLTSPQPLRTDLPTNLKASRLIIACVLDRTGLIKSPRVLEPGGADMTVKVLAALPHWKFSPALHGNQPIEVNVVLGFDIDTR